LNHFKNILIVEDINQNLLEDNNIIDEYKFTFVTHGYESLITEPTSVTGVSPTCIDQALFKSINKNKLEVSSSPVINSGSRVVRLSAAGRRGAGASGGGSASTAGPGVSCDRRLDYERLRQLLAQKYKCPKMRLMLLICLSKE
jgi:hypothetical protein